jgi:GGDEF domain-containing protein
VRTILTETGLAPHCLELERIVHMAEAIPDLAPEVGAELKHAAKAQQIADNIVERISQPIDLGDGNCAHVGASIGIAIPTEPGETADAVLRRADAAMYEAKQNGRSQARLAQCPTVTVSSSAATRGAD